MKNLWSWKSIGSGLASTGKWTQDCGFTPSVSGALRVAGNLPGVQGRQAQRYFNDAAHRLQTNPPEAWVSKQLYAGANWCGYTPSSSSRSVIASSTPTKPAVKIAHTQVQTSSRESKSQEAIRFHAFDRGEAFEGTVVGYNADARVLEVREKTVPGGFPESRQITVPQDAEDAHKRLCEKGRGLIGKFVEIGDDGAVYIGISKSKQRSGPMGRP